MRKPAFLIVLISIIILVSCNNLPVKPPTPTLQGVEILPRATSTELTTIETQGNPTQEKLLPALTGLWQIRLERSGGIAGIGKLLVISSDGKLLLNDIRTNKTSENQLSEDQTKQLVNLLATVRYRLISTPSICADCFIYDLEITNETEKFQVTLNQLDFGNAGLGSLIDFLTELIAPSY